MTRKRSAFTLVELLVVIAIISILAALTAAAVQKVRQRAQDAQCRADISQLETALGNFKARFGVYPPCSGGGPGGTFRLQTVYATTEPEWAMLTQIFPRITNGDNGLRRLQADFSPTLHTLTNAGTEGILAANPILLDSNQCLVFFLSGGIFTGYNGFASNPQTPFMGPFAQTASATTTPVSRLANGPFYEFQQSRMIYRSDFNESYFTNGNASSLRFASDAALPDDRSNAQYRREQPWYTDPWGSPYLYFGSLQNNDYPFTATAMQVGPWGGTNSPNSTGVSPFFTGSGTAKKFFAPRGYQILSAGRDKQMGPGGAYAPGSGVYALNRFGGDDYANFQQTPLGVTD